LPGRIVSLFRDLLRINAVEQELDDELQSSVELLTEEKMSEGLSRPDARRRALIELGGVEQVRTKVREVRVGHTLENFARDLRLTLRQLRNSPAFTLAATLTLVFGMGATLTIFSIVEGVLIRPLPFPEADRLVILGNAPGGVPNDGGAPRVTAPAVAIYSRATNAFSAMGAYRQTWFELSGLGEPTQIGAARLNASAFQALGVTPLLGRTFTQQEDDSGQQVAVISYQAWRDRFAGDANVLGRKLFLNRRAYEVIGVMPRTFEFPLVPGQLNRSELWVPMSFSQGELVNQTGSWNYFLLGRLKPNFTVEQARQNMEQASPEIVQHLPAAIHSMGLHARAVSLGETTVREAKPLVRMLFLAVVVVLITACANLAGLLLVRVIHRRHEIAVRMALGAKTMKILFENLIESLCISLAGGLGGLVLAWTALRVGIRFLPETLPRISAIGLDYAVVGFALLLVVLTGSICGTIPAITAAHTNLKEGGRTDTPGGNQGRLRSVLVVCELAAAVVLLSGAGLLLRSFEKLREVDLGFNTEHAIIAGFGLSGQQYSTQAAVDVFDQALLERLRALPGVEAAGVTTAVPGGGADDTTFVPEGYIPPPQAGLNLAWNGTVFGDYFQAAGIPLLRGRFFRESDTANAPLVVIVNRTLAEKYWPGQDPIGKRLYIGVAGSPMPWQTVVGEVGDIKQSGADQATLPQFYQQASQHKPAIGKYAPPNMLYGNRGSIVLRGTLPPEQMEQGLRSVVHSLDPQLPLSHVSTMEQLMREGQGSRRFMTVLISGFAAAAVLLALMGIYGVIAFSAMQRTHEFAIRLALGASRVNLLGLVLNSGVKLGLAGCLIGTIGAVFATRLLRNLLFQVSPLDPVALGLATTAILMLALAASVIPARRASSLQPMRALRSE
jgi:putative ABC transport system permease protein